MRLYFLIFTILVIILGSGCKSVDANNSAGQNMSDIKDTPESQLLAQALSAHGGDLYDKANYKFVFRGKQYTFKNQGELYKYTVTSTKNGQELKDVLSNDGIVRTLDGVNQVITDRQKVSYSGALNSVIYFATLPYKLQDPAVNMKLLEEVTIKGVQYSALQVNFDEEGGGTDHDDNFIYWINKETHRIDYLAYDYRVNKGGVRFRSAYNTRVVDGILFQDYINFKAPVGTSLQALPGLYQEEKLQQLSLIETEEVVSLN